jgi:hypothetical protein
VSYHQPVFTESESRLDDRFVVHVRDRDKPVKLWMWTLYGSPHGRREHRAWKMVDILRQAIWGRARLIIQDAVGLGPWTDAEWARIKQAVPEVFAPHPDSTGPHSIMGGGPYESATLFWARPDPEQRREDRAWLAFLDRLRGHTEVIDRPEWQRRVDGLLTTTAADGSYAAGRQD